jgi:glycosyltransferase involved in cell wall biosynthesis
MRTLNSKMSPNGRRNETRKKIKILHLITRLVVGGSQDNTLLTIARHDRTRCIVHLASNPEGVWFDRALQAADTFHPLPHLINPIHPSKDLKTLIHLVRLLRQERFDIVHTHSSKAGILGRLAARIAGVPAIVHTIHGFPFHDFMPAWKRQLYINLERSIRPCTDFFIPVCELNRQEAFNLGLLSLDNSQTVYSGIDFAKLDRPANPQQTRQQLEIPDGWHTIVMVGRLDEQKAPYYLIDALSRVLNYYPHTLLLFVGEGELQAQLQHQANQLGIEKLVRFLGSREDVPEILKVADIFALSSLWEGLGRAMTEAMLLGKPVVVPNIYGIPETVHQNQTGLLFPAGDVEQLADHLIYLLQYPLERDRLGQNAQALTRKLFDADLMVRNIEQIYENILSQKLTENELDEG